jgi:hypothetical protein
MPKPTTIEWLSEAIGQAARSAGFCVAGCLPDADPDLEVEGLGRVQVPLKRGMAKQLIASCRIAPYGQGTRTLVNKNVRNTFELEPKNFRLGEVWNSAIAAATKTVAEQLGLPPDQLEARLYKLLVYEKGGFFLPHRDSEKQNRMLASLVVVLPNPFEGGNLVARHGAAQQRWTFPEAAAGKFPCFAAFYADCEHEIEPVTRGVRIALTYNLVLKPKRAKSRGGETAAAPVDVLARSIESWVATQPAKPLVFALEHHYTQRGLSLDLLKGADRQLAKLIVSAAENADCLVHLAQVQRHLLQWADDGSFGRGYRYRYDRTPRSAIEIGETYEDELSGTQWTDLRGKSSPGARSRSIFRPSSRSVPIDDWKPTSEEFEGYTGNAGNTLDRWYHRSAIVVWRRDHHFDVVASSGAEESIPLFCSMAAQAGQDTQETSRRSRRDCVRFARAIIARNGRAAPSDTTSQSRREITARRLPQHLLLLHDRDTIAAFLSKLADVDQIAAAEVVRRSRVPRVRMACVLRGIEAAAFIATRHPRTTGDRVPRHRMALRLLLRPSRTRTSRHWPTNYVHIAVERFCEPRPPRSTYYSPYLAAKRSVAEIAPLLLKALLSCSRDEDLSRVIRFVQETPDEFSMGDCQVPSLKALIPWSRKQFGQVHPQLAPGSTRSAVSSSLRPPSRRAVPPTGPAPLT